MEHGRGKRGAEDSRTRDSAEPAGQDSIPSVTARLESIRARSKAAEQRTDTLLDAVEDVRRELEDRVASAEEAGGRLEAELRRVESSKAELEGEIATRLDSLAEGFEERLQALNTNLSQRLDGIEQGEQEVDLRLKRFLDMSDHLRAMISATENVGPGLRQLLSAVDEMRSDLGTSIATMSTVREDLRASVQSLSETQEDLRRKIAGLEALVSETRGELSETTREVVDELQARLSIVEKRTLEARELSVLSPGDFPYFRFEDLHRGSPESVRDSIRSFVRHFIRCQRVVDLGCGRGEFLDLCNQEGIGAYGVDSNEDMVLHCARIGLTVEHADIIEHLRGLKDKSLDGIFCSQVIEHLSMRKVQALFREGFRVLKVGTHMVMVTINPLSLYALANNFYLDPTHVRPLPPETMRFLAEDAGFRKLSVSYFSPFGPDFTLLPVRFDQESEEQRAIRVNFDRLNHVVFGYQEYALVGLK